MTLDLNLCLLISLVESSFYDVSHRITVDRRIFTAHPTSFILILFISDLMRIGRILL